MLIKEELELLLEFVEILSSLKNGGKYFISKLGGII